MSEENQTADTGGGEQQAQPGYFLSEGVPGSGDAPEWFKSDKYKTVADQAKGYANLEKMHGELTTKFGSFAGAPEQYQVNAPEGVELAADDPLLTSAMEWGKNNNLSQDGLDSLLGLYAGIEAAKEKASEDYYNEQVAQIENFESRAQNINQFLKANDLEALAGQVNSKEALEQFEKLLDMAGSPKLDPASEANTGPTEEEINKLMFEKDEFGRRIYHQSKERQDMVRKLLEQRVGKGQYHQVVG